MIRFSCPNCGKELKVENERLERETQCPHCHQSFEISRPFDQMAHRSPPPEIARRDSSLVEAHSSAELPVSIAGYDCPPPQRIAVNSTTLPAEAAVEPS